MRPIPKLTRRYMLHSDEWAVIADWAVFWTCIVAALVVWAVA